MRLQTLFTTLALASFAGFATAQSSAKLGTNQPPGPGADGNVCSAGCDEVLVQTPNQTNGIFSDGSCAFCGTGQQAVADEVVLTVQTEICEIVLWGGYFPGNAPFADGFDVIIHNDAAGAPGGNVYSESGVSASKFDTGTDLFGVDEYQVTLTLAVPQSLAPGTYWFEITNTGGPDTWFWEVGDLDGANGVMGSAFAFEVPGVVWANDGLNDMAWVLCEQTTPIPTLSEWGLIVMTGLLFGAGAFLIYRRTAAPRPVAS